MMEPFDFNGRPEEKTPGDELDLTGFLTGGQRLDPGRVFSLARELNRYLRGFGELKAYRPPQEASESLVLSGKIVRLLGATSLADFYASAWPAPEPPPELQDDDLLARYFPKGPESLKPALIFLNQALKLLENRSRELAETTYPEVAPAERSARHRELKRREAILIEAKADLIRAGRLWPRLKSLLQAWPEEARGLSRRCRGLAESATAVIRKIRRDEALRARAAETSTGLSEAPEERNPEVPPAVEALEGVNQKAQEFLFDQSDFSQKADNLAQELEGYLAVVNGSRYLGADWPRIAESLEGRLWELRERGRRLSESGPALRREMTAVLSALQKAEYKNLPPGMETGAAEVAESLVMGAEDLAGALSKLKETAARLFFELPVMIYRPKSLERTYLATALALSRAWSFLETIQNQLGPLVRRRAQTRELRLTIKNRLAALAKPTANEEFLARLERRLRTFKLAVTRAWMAPGPGAPENEDSDQFEEMAALTAEKDRLKEELQAARAYMAELGRAKVVLLKEFQAKTRHLEELHATRAEAGARLDRYRAALKKLGRRYRSLRDEYQVDRGRLDKIKAKFKGRAAELKGNQELLAELAQERNQALAKLEQIRAELEVLGRGRRELSAALQKVQDSLGLVTAEKETLEVELARRRDELARAAQHRERMAQAMAGYRKSLDKLSTAYRQLARKNREQGRDLAQLRQDRQRLSTKSLRQQRALARLAAKRQAMLAELGITRLKLDGLIKEREKLLDDLGRAQDDARSHEQGRAQARAELDRLNRQVEEELYPVIKMFGLALWRSESQLGRIREENRQFHLKSSASEAGLRIKAAAREIELVERAEQRELQWHNLSREKEAAWNSLLSQRETAIAELNAGREELGRKLAYRARLSLTLSLALSGLNHKVEKRDQALRFLKRRTDQRLAEAQEIQDGLLGLTRRQAKEIQEQREILSQLTPVLGYFLEQAATVWAPAKPPRIQSGGQEAPDIWLALVHFLRLENQNLGERLAISEEHRQNQAQSQLEIQESHRRMRKRLSDLGPLMAFLAQSFVSNVAELALARKGRQKARAELDALKRNYEEAQAQLAAFSASLDGAGRQLAHSQNQLLEARRRGQTLAENQARQAAVLERAQKELEQLNESRRIMAQTLKAKQADLAEVTDQAFKLTVENRQLAQLSQLREQELAVTRQDREHLAGELKAQAGRLESSWAALNYLGAKADDAVARLKARLETQSGALADLRRRLKEREEEVKRLETTQDRVALLYWTILSRGDRLDWAEALKEAKNLDQQLAGQKLLSLGDANKRSGAVRLDWKEFSKDARKAARRGILAMLLAAGLVMTNPREAAVHSGLPARGSGLLADLIKASPTDPAAIAGRLESTYVNRVFDLSFLPPWERAKGFGHIQSRIEEEVVARAREWDLQPREYVDLIKMTYGPDDLVSLDDLNSDYIGYAFLTSHFPALTQAAARAPEGPNLPRRELSRLLKFAAHTDPAEGRFWDRMLNDFHSLSGDKTACLNMIMANYRQHREGRAKLALARFSGNLTPIPEIEALDLPGFKKLAAPYIKSNLRSFEIEPGFMVPADVPDPPIDQYAQRLAEDMYFSARLFEVPLTLMVVIAHQETHFANILGDRNRSASPFQIFQPTKPLIAKYLASRNLKIPLTPPRLEKTLTLATYMAAAHMADLIGQVSVKTGQGSVCDLDRVALRYNGGPDYPPAVYQKKLRLQSYVKRQRHRGKTARLSADQEPRALTPRKRS